MIPSHTKVAWAFLDKLLGRKPPPDRDPRTLSMKERNDWLDQSTNQMAEMMEKAVKNSTAKFDRQLRQIARKRNLDPRAIYFWLMKPRNQWPPLPHDLRRWLDVGGSALATFGFPPPMPGRVRFTPEVAAQVADAFVDLAKWARKEMKQDLEQQYLKVLQREARELVPVYTYPEHPVPSVPKVTLALMHEFEWRLKHARLMVGTSHLIRRIFRLFT